MTLGEDEALDFAKFRDHQGTGVLNVVGVADVEDVAAAVKVAHCCDEFRTRRPCRTRTAGSCLLALALHETHLQTGYLVSAHPSYATTFEKYRESYRDDKSAILSAGKPRGL